MEYQLETYGDASQITVFIPPYKYNQYCRTQTTGIGTVSLIFKFDRYVWSWSWFDHRIKQHKINKNYTYYDTPGEAIKALLRKHFKEMKKFNNF